MARGTERTYKGVIPLDGQWASDGVHASIYCGTCHRWIDALSVDEDPGAVKLRHHWAVHAAAEDYL